MSKKLLGERQIGDVVYTAGQIISDDEFAASGLLAVDVVNVSETAAGPVVAQETVVAPADVHADLDTQTKQEGQQSSPAGSDASSESGAVSTTATPSAEELTLEHVLTEQDLTDNPHLAAEGHTVGQVVRIPAIEREITAEDLAADGTLTERGLTVGDKALFPKQ